MADELDPSWEVDVLASMLLADLQDSGDLFERLAAKFGSVLPEWTSIEREGGLFSRSKRVRRLSVDVGNLRFSIVREKHGPATRRCKLVRGVEILPKDLPLEAWATELGSAIKALAVENEAARRALSRLVDGEPIG